MERSFIDNNPLTQLGGLVIDRIRNMGRLTLFAASGFILIFKYPFQIRRIIEQTFFIGTKSVFVILLTGSFTGMVLGLQGYYALSNFGSEGMLGSLVSLSLIREMGPVLTAIMVVGRAGSAMAAELGIMRISEQIDALETMDINPVRFLVSPRIVAALISFPILTAVFDLVGIIGGYLTGSILLGINAGIYTSGVEASVQMTDIRGGFIKAIVFAFLVVSICCYKGFFTHLQANGHGAKGVSLSTTSAVVMCCVVVLVTDYILTSFLL